NADVITTVYIGTETGLHVAYDTFSDIGVVDGSPESYFDYSESEWYVLARDTGEIGFTGIYQDSYGRGLMVTCYAPFYDNQNRFAGAVCLDMLIADIYQGIVSMDLGEEGSVFLVDQNGNTVNPENPEELVAFSEITNNKEISSEVEKMKAGFYVSDDNVYYAYAPVELAGWKLCIDVPEEAVLQDVREVDKKIQRANLYFLGALLLLAGVIAAVSRRFSRTLTDPLIELGKDVEKISQGNLDYRAKIPSNDEV
ncbi:MAG: cache and HAMP domain-containing protein, partial [Lachnospiraceae bacterium]|nr:cache and HAMP domain-containing protein [Lachnospiraceae bacterium]